MSRETPLYEAYKEEEKVKYVDFYGWKLPLHFGGGILTEHSAVRSNAGMFDVSHMGEFEVAGSGSRELLDLLLTNDVSKLVDGKALYSPMCNHAGGTIDDLLVYRHGPDRFMVVVNAGNRKTDLAWIQRQADSYQFHDVVIKDRSDEIVLIAVQGPQAESILYSVAGGASQAIRELKRFYFIDAVDICGISCIVSRTGYTGEDGFELYIDARQAIPVWRAFRESGVSPCGLGARDTLRFEACLPLYGHELRSDVSPLEAGLRFAIKLKKKNFIGKEPLLAMSEQGIPRKLVGIEMYDRGVPRQGYAIYIGDRPIGEVTSGMKAPSIDAFLALALVDSEYAATGTRVFVDINGKMKEAGIVPVPFYHSSS